MESEDVVNVLGRFREALTPNGVILDLQAIPPRPVVEIDGKAFCEIEGDSLLDAAAAAAAAVGDFVEDGLLREEALDDHDVRRHFPTGAALVAHFETRSRSIPAAATPTLVTIDRPCAVREACRLRRLRVTG